MSGRSIKVRKRDESREGDRGKGKENSKEER